ncbi:MAG: hypothetical protein M3O15_07140 [Acidobacteriota bacterium]|nr:hypothetical protein [Acidobacteriota bacterium]
MATLDPQKPESFARVQEVISRIAPEWRTEANVIDIVPALKTRGRRLETGALVIGFHVIEKVPPELLADRGFRPIPPEVEGIPTDVIVARAPALGSVDTKDTRSQLFDTLVGGIAVGNANKNYYGTLAMPLFAQSDSRMVGLTNEHVLVFDGDGHVGDEVDQPRFDLKSEVSLDSASCCPNGQLHYRGVHNPVVDAAAAVFATTALAAALSDEIDPHRRGQDATHPAATERTWRETVQVELGYPQMPLPGTPYQLDVTWKYERQTDLRTLTHNAVETKQNEHTIDAQALLTDHPTYQRGQTVRFLAFLGHEPKRREGCGDYFVTAAALSPSQKRAYKVILRPTDLATILRQEESFSSEASSFAKETVRRCHGFTGQPERLRFAGRRLMDGLLYDSQGRTAEIVRSPAGLRFVKAVRIELHLPADQVLVAVELEKKQTVLLTALRHGAEVGTARVQGGGAQTIEIAAPGITALVLHARDATLLRVCTVQDIRRACLYTGTFELAPDEELGTWPTFLFAQTRNSASLGMAPTLAAQSIGCLPVTDNFIFIGDYEQIQYGHQCHIDIVPDGSFQVVAPSAIG